MAARIGLDRVEEDILAFSLLLHEIPVMEACSDFLGSLSGWRVIRVLAESLGYAISEVQGVLHHDGALRASGLIELAPRGRVDLRCALDVLPGLDRLLLSEGFQHAVILKQYLKDAPASRAKLPSFPHLKEDIRWIRLLLAEAMSQHAEGINILFYGAPGVGKTELARALAEDIGAHLYEVGYSFHHEGEHRGDFGRFRAFQFSQAMLAGDQGSLILFDEIEDVFPRSAGLGWRNGSGSSQSKAWINQALESNSVPAFWLTNEVRQIDPAFLRRFTYVLEIPAPPESVRREMLKAGSQDLPVREQWICEVAREVPLTPAQVHQMTTVARLTGVKEPEETEGLCQQMLRNTCEVLGQQVKLLQADDALEYRLELLNAAPDVHALVDGLLRRPTGRLCLYGPPGTGKTALAHHLAHRLDKPLIKRTASELLSMWLGGTEKAFANMFRQAERESAVLLLDEADSFLYDRRTAQRSWEVTQVNELLVQMEAFGGLFLCSTNLMETLDPAVLRRFDVKVRFDFLTIVQVEALFIQLLATLGESTGPERIGTAIRHRLARLRNLTPGDFASVLRKVRILGDHRDAVHLLAALEEESQTKQRGGKPVSGFVAG
jgi:SpoVK/Ycf46/Vps4 family AAA+-type ATPase